MPAKRRRKHSDFINVRLSAIDDADLIEWWESQPDGAGAAAVKAAIRYYRDSASDSTPATKAELAYVSEQVAEQKALLMQLITVVAGLTRRIEAGGTVNAPQTTVETSEEQRLSEREQSERLTRIKGNRW